MTTMPGHLQATHACPRRHAIFIVGVATMFTLALSNQDTATFHGRAAQAPAVDPNGEAAWIGTN